MTIKKSRTEMVALNSATGIFYQLIRTISIFVIPRLVITNWGSAYNGITNSISQFLSVISLMSAGIGGVSTAALYKPLAQGNIESISRIIVATERFLRKIALIFAFFLLVFAAIYPFLIKGQFEWLFSFTLIIIIGISTIAEYCFGMTYRFLLRADQKAYIVNLINSAATFFNMILAVWLIRIGFGIHIVKLGSAVAFSINPIFLYLYAKKKYKIRYTVEPDNDSIKQRWDAFAHQVAVFIHTNTDVMVLTILTTLKEVSIYSVYAQVTNGIYTILKSIYPGLDSAFGDMFARNEQDAIKKSFAQVEVVVFSLSSVFFTTGIAVIIPFIKIYTREVADANYIQPGFGYILLIASFVFAVRLPYQNIIEAVGHYKQTKKYSYIEAITNIVVSVVLVFRLGIIGVAIGTLIANIYRTIVYVQYISKNLIPGVLPSFVKHFIIAIISGGISLLIFFNVPKIEVINFVSWIGDAFIIMMISFVIVFIGDVFFFKTELLGAIDKVKRILNRFI